MKALSKADSIAEAGRIAGYSGRDSAHTALETIKLKMPELMDKMGLTDEMLINNYLRPGLEANETKFFAEKGVVMETREVVSWGDRRGFLDMAFKLKGKYAAKDDPDDKQSGGITFNLAVLDPARASTLLASLTGNQRPAVLVDALHEDGR